MESFESDGVKIAYHLEGEASAASSPILLIHGFASNTATNWIATGWVRTLTRAGRQVIAFDNRGHGESEKLYDPEAYGAPIMAEDARRLLDHLGISSADVMGYSMGARIAAFLAMAHPDRVHSAIFAGLGSNMVRGLGGSGPIATALEADSLDDVKNDTARTFRAFAEQTGSDLRALAACIRSSREKITPEALGKLQMPVLVAVGSEDVIGGPPQKLAELMPNARALLIEGRDHMKAVGDKQYKQGVLDFLASQER